MTNAPRSLLWIIAIYCFSVLTLFHATAWSMVSTWSRSETYTHGFLIVPISLWLIWRQRAMFASLPTDRSYLAFALLICSILGWIVSSLVDVLVLQHLALICILVFGVLSIVGHTWGRLLAFPLGYLFLAVPMGEDLIPPLMEFTASSTVWLIQQTGIPVYREGLFFSLPSGNWSVIEACSGSRYLIASVTLGLLYAHLSYRSLSRKTVFVIASIIVPIAANSLRAYIIVMLGHLSDMKIATGVDHLIYGWVFFGLVIFLLFWIGSFWRDSDGFTELPENFSGAVEKVYSPSRALIWMLVLLLFVGLGQVVVKRVNSSSPVISSSPLVSPVSTPEWLKTSDISWDWAPINLASDRKIAQFYKSGEQTTALYLYQYLNQKQGAELVGSSNKFVVLKGGWKIASKVRSEITVGGYSADVDQVHLRSGSQELFVWSWYRIGKRYTANTYVAKALEALERFKPEPGGSARIVIATSATDWSVAQSTLSSFLESNLPAIESTLDSGIGGL
jgi:exosortase A